MKQFYNSCLKSVLGVSLSLVMLLSIPQMGNATHIIGGDLTYKCLGNNMYEVTLELRRDCLLGQIDFDDEISVSILSGNGILLKGVGDAGELIIPFMGSGTISEADECDVLGGDVCVETTKYIKEIELPFNPQGYILAYQRCCYNSSVVNIVDPLNTGLTAWVRLTTTAQSECNSSPYFPKWEDIYICQGMEHNFDHAAVDVDGDSLAYELFIPDAGADKSFPRPQPITDFPPFDKVVFSSGFGLDNFLGGNGKDALSIDNETGAISVTPNFLGQYLVGVAVKEYRNGELLSRVQRVFEYNVRICNVEIEASFDVDLNPRCDGLAANFINTSTTTGLSIDCEMTITDENGQVVDISAADIFDVSFPATGTYLATLVCKEGECNDVVTQQISVSVDDPVVDFAALSSGCEDDIAVSIQNNSSSSVGNVNCDWMITDASGNLVATDPDFNIAGNQTLMVTVTCTSELGCSASLSRTIDVSGINVNLNVDNNMSTCGGEDVIIVPNTGNLDYTITPSANVVIDPLSGTITILNPTVTTDYIVEATDGVCSDSETITLTVIDDIDLVLQDQDVCINAPVELNPNGDPSCIYQWSSSTDPGFSSTDPNPTVSLNESGVYTVTATKGSCSETASMALTVTTGGELGLIDLSTCEGVTTPLNPAGLNNLLNYNWTSPDIPGFSSTDPNPFVSVDETSTFMVTAEDASGCAYMDQMTITVLEAPSLDLPSDPLHQCEGTSIELYPNADPSLIYTWICDDEDLIFDSTAPNPTVSITENTLCVVSVSDGSCSSTGTVIVNFLEGPGPINLEDGSHCEGLSHVLNPDGLPDGDYSWVASDPGLNFSSTVPSPEVSVDQTTTFTATVSTPDGCLSVETVTVTVGSEIMIDFPSTITQCHGTAVSLNPNGTDSGYNYNWAPVIPGVLDDPNDPFPIVELLVNTQFCVTVTSDEGCIQNACMTVEVVDNPEINFSPETYTVCEGEELCLFALTGSGMTGSGMGGGMTGSGTGVCMTGSGSMTGSGTMTGSGSHTGSGIFNQTGSGINIFGGSATGSGTVMWTLFDGTVVGMGDPFCISVDMDYSLVAKVTNEFGCVAMDTVNILAAPAIGLLANAFGMGPYCVGDTLELIAEGNGIIDINWFLPDSTLIASGNPGFWVYDGSEVVWAQADNGLGCVEEFPVCLEAAPEINLAITTTDNGCGSVTLTATGDYNNMTWYMEDPFMEIGSGPSLELVLDSAKVVIATATNDAGCEESVSEEILVIPGPQVDVDINGMLVDELSICPGDEVVLTAISDPDGLDVLWSTGDTTSVIIVSPSSDTTICVTVTDENDCTKETCVTITASGGLDVEINANPTPFCEGESVDLSAVSIGGDITDCTWSTGETGASISVTPVGASTYSVTCTDSNGCTGEASITLEPDSKQVSIFGDLVVCEGNTGVLTVDPDDPNCTYVWSNGTVGSSTTINGPGNYTVEATDNNTGCSAVASFIVTDGFDVDVSASSFPGVIDVGDSSELCAEPTGAGFTYEWTDEAGNVIGTTECVDVTPETTSTYTVCVTNADGCVRCATTTVTIDTPPCAEQEPGIPNLFTPNNDGSNDCYQIENFDFYETMKLIIYNRWGEEVFMTMNNECWDGSFDGEFLPADVYGYHLTWTCEGDLEETRTGNITLLK